jgi:hypothetical protein
VVPAIRYLKERFQCEMAFHWYGSNGELFDANWRCPEIYPENEDIRTALCEGVRRLHELGVHCLTYGTVQTFAEQNLGAFRLAEAFCLVGGQQLMVSGFFAGDEDRPEVQPHLAFMERLARAHKAARKWLNLGRWMPPVELGCDRVDVPFDPELPPKQDVPSIVHGCFELDGELCLVLVNHTGQTRKARFGLDPEAYGLDGETLALRSLWPDRPSPTRPWARGRIAHEVELPAAAAEVLLLS